MNINELDTYELVEQCDLNDIQSEGYLLRHKKSGAKVVLISNDDENKVFTIGFRTPISDSTGVPHILEHSVLCGSKKFPAKDPFVELVKGSLNTFLNAMTYPDKTIYPVASCNEKDFQNLMNVYMDAVLNPNIYEHEEIFKQEGWSYKLNSPEDKLEYNGVVYNEMKGAFSSADGVLDRVILNSLFPDTTYANESGGDPEVIPELTYEQFLEFHKTYYHPSNSYIFLYGDMDMAEKLQWLDKEYLHEYDAKEIDSEVKKQKAFLEMKEETISYSISSNESEEDNTYLSWNKVIGTTLDKELYLAFQILDYGLLSAPGAPLKKALIDAHIGKDVLGSYDNGVFQPIFSVVSKNANVNQKEEFIGVIEDTLKDIVKNGMDRKALEAGINYNEFHYREADYGRYPKGLMYGIQMFDSWLYDENSAFMHLEVLDTFAFLRKNLETDYFENLIQTYLIDNKHGSIVIVKPEKGRTARMEQELEEKLGVYKASLSQEEIEKLVADTKALEEYQSEPSSPEILAKIPALERKDISRSIAPIQNEKMEIGSVDSLFHEVETNGIGYLSLLFDAKDVPDDLVPYLGILQSVLGMMDTENYEYGELFNEINIYTGGIGGNTEIYPNASKVQQKQYEVFFEMKAKALYSKLGVAISMMEEMIMRTKFHDEKRLEELFDMLKSRLQSKFQSAGHTTAVARAMAYSSEISAFKEAITGIEFYDTICYLSEHFQEKKGEIIQNLERLCKILFRPDKLKISYTASREGLEDLDTLISDFTEHLYQEVVETVPYKMCISQKNEGFKTSSKVQYVARTGNFMDQGYSYTGALQILKVILSYDYLWLNVRVKGGAYGCMSGFNRIGEGFFTSYRDPNLEKTLEVYAGVVEYLKNFDVSERDMTKYIIGTISNIDQPMTPSAKGERSLNLYLNHVSADMIQKERKQILEATQEDIRALAGIVEAVLKADNLCVIGGEDKIKKNEKLFKEVKDLF